MKFYLYNVAHPMADGGRPIFIPFGEWNYDGTCRQRLDRAHGERIANELNARVAGGEPGIPVYQGHPDVPELAAKYPDKGALGWVTKIELANEGGRDGLALTVEWDRDPGRGFRWFSPYWVCGERDGMSKTLIVGEIASIGLVNNPNIPEFRLANEARGGTGTYTLPPLIVELAGRRDTALANEANYDESKHPRSDDGKWTSGGGGASGGAAPKQSGDVAAKFKAAAKKAAKDPAAAKYNDALKAARSRKDGAGIARAHMAALKAGYVWDKSIKGYRKPVVDISKPAG